MSTGARLVASVRERRHRAKVARGFRWTTPHRSQRVRLTTDRPGGVDGDTIALIVVSAGLAGARIDVREHTHDTWVAVISGRPAAVSNAITRIGRASIRCGSVPSLLPT